MLSQRFVTLSRMSICINPNCANPHNRETLLFCHSCGSELLIDGRYRTTRQLGGGGFSKTYEVFNYSLDQLESSEKIAKVLKVLTHNRPKYVELFEREARVLAQLNHPGIPRVEPDDFFTYHPNNSQDPLYCLVMEKIEGLNLLEYSTRRGNAITQKRAIQWLIQLTTILQEVHKHNFFHRDIKPSNIMLRVDGQLALIDFGAARQVSETFMTKQSQGQITGVISAGYTPLEQMHGQAVPQSDFFALGRTFVYLLTGSEPSDFYDSVTDTLNWQEAAPDISPEFANFLNYLMARLPHDRPKSASEIRQQLTAIYQKLYPSQRNSPASAQSSPPSLMPIAEPTQALTMVDAPEQSFSTSTTSKLPGTTGFPDLSQPVQRLPLQPDFISRCQQALAEYIGPMASIVCQRLLSKMPEISAQEFVEKLALKIANEQQSTEFKKRLLNG